MAGLYDMVYTDEGAKLVAGILAEEAKLDMTKIVVGKGYMPDGKGLGQMEAMVQPVADLPIKKKERMGDESEIVIGTMFDNTEMAESFFYRELGVFAKAVHPDGSESKEVLYMYGNAGDSAEYIPAHSGNTVVEKKIDIVVYVGRKTNVVLEVAEAFFVTKEEVAAAFDSILDAETVALAEEVLGIDLSGPAIVP